MHKGAAQLILQDTRAPKNKQVYYDAFKYARPAFNTPYGQRAIDVLNQDGGTLRTVWEQGPPVKSVILDAVSQANEAMQQEIAADTKK